MANFQYLCFPEETKDKLPMVLDGLSTAFTKYGLTTEEVCAWKGKERDEIIIGTQVTTALFYEGEEARLKSEAEWSRVGDARDSAVAEILSENNLVPSDSGRIEGTLFELKNI